MGMTLDRRKSAAFNKINNLQKRLKESHNRSFSVGVHEESGKHPDSGYSYAALAAHLHNGFAASNLPPRPFLTWNCAIHQKKYSKLIKRALAKFLLSDKHVKLEVLITDIARVQMNDVRNQFGVPSPVIVSNAPSTITKKGGRDAPLIDTGALRDHIGFKLNWSGSIQYS